MGFGQILGKHTATGLVDTAINGIGQGIGHLFQRSNMRYQRDMQADLMHLQDRINDENLKDEREYNDPSAVASRARSAGVAPSALLGGTPGGPGVSSTSRVSGLGVSPGSVSPGVGRGNISGLMQAQNQKDLVESQVFKNRAEGEAALASAGLTNVEKDVREFYRDSIQPIEKEIKQLGVDGYRLDNYLKRQAYDIAEAKESRDKESHTLAMENLNEQNNKVRQEISNLVKVGKLTDKQAEELSYNMLLKQSQALFYDESARNAAAQALKSISEEELNRQLYNFNEQVFSAKVAQEFSKSDYWKGLSDKVKQDVYLGWASLGLNAVDTLSDNTLSWVKFFFGGKDSEDSSSGLITDFNPGDLFKVLQALGTDSAALGSAEGIMASGLIIP